MAKNDQKKEARRTAGLHQSVIRTLLCHHQIAAVTSAASSVGERRLFDSRARRADVVRRAPGLF
jgi:hypothetical protein